MTSYGKNLYNDYNLLFRPDNGSGTHRWLRATFVFSYILNQSRQCRAGVGHGALGQQQKWRENALVPLAALVGELETLTGQDQFSHAEFVKAVRKIGNVQSGNDNAVALHYSN